MKIVAVRKDSNDSIVEYKLENGTVIDREEAVQMVEEYKLDGYSITVARDGSKAIRSNPDGNPHNNLDNLPSF